MNQTRKEKVKLPLFVNGLIYIRDPKAFTRQLLGLLNNFSKMVVY